jgi:hypothetical protein
MIENGVRLVVSSKSTGRWLMCLLCLLLCCSTISYVPPQPKVSALPKTSSSLSNDLLTILDLNKDGTMSYNEFEHLLETYNIQSVDDYDINLQEGVKLFKQLDADENGKITSEEIASAIRRQSNFKAMTSEDVQVWLEKCTELRKYRAHFLEHEAKGTDLMRPSSSESLSVRNILKHDHTLLRAAVMGALLRSYYLQNATAYIPPPKLVDVRATLITMKIIRSETRSRFLIVKYKVQICRTSVKASWRRTTVPECGFGWKSVWPTDGISEVRFVGLSPMTSYKLRVRAFHCDGKSISGDTVDVQTLPKPTAKQILMSPNKWLKLCYLSPLTPAAPLLVSRTSHSVLLEWGKSCTIDSSHLRMSQECGNQEGSGAGWGLPILSEVSTFLHEQMYCTKQKFIIQYVELNSLRIRKMKTRLDEATSTNPLNVIDGGSVDGSVDGSINGAGRGSDGKNGIIDAHCHSQDVTKNTMNDNPMDCLVKDLKPGTMYSFRLAVEVDNKRSDFSTPQHVMTHCLRDEDCSWGNDDLVNATCNQHTRLCEGFDPLLLHML